MPERAIIPFVKPEKLEIQNVVSIRFNFAGYNKSVENRVQLGAIWFKRNERENEMKQ